MIAMSNADDGNDDQGKRFIMLPDDDGIYRGSDETIWLVGHDDDGVRSAVLIFDGEHWSVPGIGDERHKIPASCAPFVKINSSIRVDLTSDPSQVNPI
jgi:hypothetical protein